MRTIHIRVYALSLLVYGGLIHSVLLWGHYRRTQSITVIIDSPWEAPTLILLGAVSVGWFMVRLLRRTVALEVDRPLLTVLKGGLYGILATTFSLASFCALASLISLYYVSRGPDTSLRMLPLTFFFILMGFAASVVQPISLPFAFIYGAVAGAFISWARAHYGLRPISVEKPRALGTEGLALGVIGLTLCWLPRYGLVPSALASFLGVYTLWRVKALTTACRYAASAGLVLAAISLAIMGYIAVTSSRYHFH